MNSLDLIKTMASHPGICLFAKDLKGRYLYCNEQMAEAAGLDSSAQIVNKKDDNLIWKKQASIYANGDQRVLSGNEYSLRPETQNQISGVISVITTKLCIKDIFGNPVGVTGCYWQRSSHCPERSALTTWSDDKKYFYIKTTAMKTRITRREATVLYLIILGYSLRVVGAILNISENTAFFHFKRIKTKLGRL